MNKTTKSLSMISMLLVLLISMPARADMYGEWKTEQGYPFTISQEGLSFYDSVLSGLKIEIDVSTYDGPEKTCGVSSFLASFDDFEVEEDGDFWSQSLSIYYYYPVSLTGSVTLNSGEINNIGEYYYVDFYYSANFRISKNECSYNGYSSGYVKAEKQGGGPIQTYTLTVNKTGNGDGTVFGSGTYPYNSIVAVWAIPNLGSKFTGWQPESCAEPFQIVADTVCTANFVLDNYYNIATQVAPLSGGTVTCIPNPVTTGGASSCSAIPNVGYEFDSWGGDCSGQSGSTCTLSNVTMNKSVVGNFKQKSNLLMLGITKTGLGSGTVTSDPAGINCGGTCSNSFANGQVVKLAATPAKGSTFTGWSGSGCAGNGTCQITMNGPKTANADFSLLPPFGDVDSNGWAAGYIYALRNEGITGGCGNGNYCPKDLVTREQMAAFIIRSVEDNPSENYCSGISPFFDVDAMVWSCPHIKRLGELKITGGCGNGNYCPKAFVTREQMAAFIIRALEGDPPNGYCQGVPPFNDMPASSWACGHVKRLIEEGITQGCGNGNYCPSKFVTREEMAAFLGRAFLGMD